MRNFLKIIWTAIALPLNVLVFSKDPSIVNLLILSITFCYPVFWLWEWHRRVEARIEIYYLASTLPAMTEEEREHALTAIAEFAVRLHWEPHDIARLFKLID
jgi:hypothetical protein